jgi:hypothetical protein
VVAQAVEASGEGPQPRTIAADVAAKEIELVPSSSNKTGFRGVTKSWGKKYEVRIGENGTSLKLGTFATPQ